MKRLASAFWLIVSHLPWVWISLWYLAYHLSKTAPTPWHAQCVYFSVVALLVLSIDVRDLIRDGVSSLEKSIEYYLKK